MYLWKRKDVPLKMMKRTEKMTKEAETTINLKFAEKSRLRDLSKQIETQSPNDNL